MANVSGRSCEYDLVRITLMVMLPLIHVVQYWGYVCDGADLIVRSDVDALYPIVQVALYYIAPCFMIMMGINMLFTRHSSPKDFLRRGVMLLCLELVFNLVRYVLPALVGFLLGEYKQEVMDYAIYGIFNSDILAFAGLAFIVMAGLKKLKLSAVGVMAVAVVMWLAGTLTTRFAGPWLNGHCSSQLLNILGSFVWVNTDSNFPLLTWMVYPAIGYLFMDCLRRTTCTRKKEWIWGILCVGGLGVMNLEVVVTRYLGLPLYETLSVNGAHHFLSPQVVLFSTSATFFVMGICHVLALLVQRHNRLEQLVIALGSKLTVFYLIQWTLVGWGLFLTGGTNLWGCQQLTLWPTVLAVIAITAVSVLPAIIMFRKGDSLRF